jgi:nucleotide-binding universal stress UspA family protein
MFHKILVAIDGSDVSLQAFEQAVALAAATQAKLMLLHVLSPFDEAYPSPVFPSVDGIYPGIHTEAVKVYMSQWQSYEQKGLDMLRSQTAIATEAGVATEFSQNVGNPGRSICEVARTWEADLIMIGRRGLSGLSELFMGSVSNYVLHHATCSVLTVQLSKQPKGEQPVAREAVVGGRG